MENLKVDEIVLRFSLGGVCGLPDVFFNEKIVIKRNYMTYTINYLVNQKYYKDYEPETHKPVDYSWKVFYRNKDELFNKIVDAIEYKYDDYCNETGCICENDFMIRENRCDIYVGFKANINGKKRHILDMAYLDKNVFDLIKEFYKLVKAPGLPKPYAFIKKE